MDEDQELKKQIEAADVAAMSLNSLSGIFTPARFNDEEVGQVADTIGDFAQMAIEREREACAKLASWFLAQTDLSMDELPEAIRDRKPG